MVNPPHQARALPDDLRAVLQGGMQPRSYAKGATIHAPDRASDRFFLIESGMVRFTALNEEGAERELFTLGEGEVFSEISLFSGFAPPHHATAMQDSFLRSVDWAGLQALMDDNPALRDWLLARLARRLLFAYHQMNQDRYSSAPDRIMGYLGWLADNGFGSADDTGGTAIAITQQALADRVGLSRSTVAETIEILRADGRIATGYGKIVLPPRI